VGGLFETAYSRGIRAPIRAPVAEKSHNSYGMPIVGRCIGTSHENFSFLTVMTLEF
jgi:hypothetical protein